MHMDHMRGPSCLVQAVDILGDKDHLSRPALLQPGQMLYHAGELGERVSMLKRITSDIHSEVDAQNRLLDGMGGGMDGVRAALAGTVERVTRAFNDKGNRQLVYVAGGTAFILFVLYYAVRR